MSKREVMPIRIEKDGSEWCATRSDFVNLQESTAGFGNSPVSALNALMVEERHEARIRMMGLAFYGLTKFVHVAAMVRDHRPVD
jgi:hypothetical protein